MSSTALGLLYETQRRASRMCLLSGISSCLLCKPPSGGGKWSREQVPWPKMHLSSQHLLRSLSRSNTLVMHCNRVSLSSALQSLAITAVAIAGPLLLLLCLLHLAVILSLPSQMGCSLDMLCVTGMAVTPPQVILFSLISALACTSGQVRIDKDLCVCVC